MNSEENSVSTNKRPPIPILNYHSKSPTPLSKNNTTLIRSRPPLDVIENKFTGFEYVVTNYQAKVSNKKNV